MTSRCLDVKVPLRSDEQTVCVWLIWNEPNRLCSVCHTVYIEYDVTTAQLILITECDVPLKKTTYLVCGLPLNN